MQPNATSRLRFREMSSDDLDEMGDLLGDPRVMEYYPQPKDREAAATWIEWNQRNYATHGYGLWIIEDNDGKFIGDCGLTWQKLEDSIELEVGYHVKSSAHGRGFAAEAAAACRDFARSRALASRLVAIVHQDNRASQRVAEKIGMGIDPRLNHSSSLHIVHAMDL